MEKKFEILKKCPLFAGIEENNISLLLNCLNAKEEKIHKDNIIFLAGDKPEYVGIVLSGSVQIIQEDYWGNRTILSIIEKGGIFAEAFSCAGADAFPISVVSREDGLILLIDCIRILTTCSSSCTFHGSLIQNLVKVLANKNIALTRKMEHITKRTTREKVLSYLSECAISANSNTFDIPFNRQEMADYLSVERSALSSTLGKLKEDKLIDFYKNTFCLNQPPQT